MVLNKTLLNMTTQNTPAPLESRSRYWRRVLRPIFWWLLLVLVLFGVHKHQQLMETTRLNFTVTLAGQTAEATATFDGKRIFSGQQIPLGHHQFMVTHPNGETYSTNLFIWYGAHNFGIIDLKRTMGTLSVTVDPPADWLVIRGPEWSVTLSNSAGLTKLVPTDAYIIEAGYPHSRQNSSTCVFANQTATCNIAPHFGGLKLGCDQSDAVFQLLVADGQLVSEGSFPATVSKLPQGDYKVTTTHHGHQRTDALTVKADTISSVEADFQYGKVVFETSPTGAAVVTANGNWGQTPLTLTELLPGDWTFTLERNGYQSVQVSLNVAANQTVHVSTNLVSETYLHAMEEARQYMAAADYDHALQSAGDALAARPADAEARTIQNEATGLGGLKRAQALGTQGDYIGGGKLLALALQLLPDNEEIKNLIADFKKHEPEQIERERVERLNRPRQVYNDALKTFTISGMFEDHEIKTTMPANAAASAISDALATVHPAYKLTGNTSPKPETYYISAWQEDSSILATPTARRQCIIVCGQATDKETQIFYKVLEFKTEAQIKFSIGNLIGTPVAVNYIPIDASKEAEMTDKLRAQIQAGVSNLTVRIQFAIGQTPAVQPTASP